VETQEIHTKFRLENPSGKGKLLDVDEERE